QKLRVKQTLKEQHPVIPLRIYLAALNSYTNEVQLWNKYKDQLEQAVQAVFEYEQTQANSMLQKLRNGTCSVGQVFNNADKKYLRFINELKKH
ncbi:site-specific integrase, partial [Escherichia coli]